MHKVLKQKNWEKIRVFTISKQLHWKEPPSRIWSVCGTNVLTLKQACFSVRKLMADHKQIKLAPTAASAASAEEQVQRCRLKQKQQESAALHFVQAVISSLARPGTSMGHLLLGVFLTCAHEWVQAWDCLLLSFYSNVALKSIGICTTEHTKSFQWQLHDKYGVASHAMLKSWRSLLLCELETCVCFVRAYKLPALRNKLHTPEHKIKTFEGNSPRLAATEQPLSFQALFFPHWPSASGLCVDEGGARMKWKRVYVEVGLSALLPSRRSNTSTFLLQHVTLSWPPLLPAKKRW